MVKEGWILYPVQISSEVQILIIINPDAIAAFIVNR
jgi:hypothetical protein